MSWLDDINAAMGRSQNPRQDDSQEASGGSSDRLIFSRQYNGDYVRDDVTGLIIERD